MRVLGNAQDAYQLSQTQIALPGGRFVKLADLGQVQDSNSEQRSLAKQNGHQVVTFSIQRAKGSSEVTAYDGLWKELQALEKENPKVHFSEVFTTVDYTEGAVPLGDGRADRGRGPRGSRRSALPPRHPRDRDFRDRDPALGDPGVLFHEPDGNHAELHVDDGDGPRRGRSRRRRDRRDREHRPAHAHGQVGLSGGDRRRGRDRPCRARDDDGDRRRLPPGRADAGNRRPVFQGVRLHRRSVGADELVRRAHDHAADRGLFPALARAAAARELEVDGSLSEGSQLEPRHDQGPCAAGQAAQARRQIRLLRRQYRCSCCS